MDSAPSPPIHRTFQFDVQSLFWLVFTVGLCLAFLRGYGRHVVGEAAIAIAIATFVGGLIGWPRRRLADVIYWTVLGAVVAFMSVTGAALPHWSARYAWILTGMVTGAAIGSVPDDRPVTTFVVGTLVASAIITAHAAYLYHATGEAFVFDVICAALAGAVFAGTVIVFHWLEHQRFLRRDSSAAILMLLVLIANCIDRYLAP